MPILTIRNLRVTKQGTVICALEELFINQGERVAVLGVNGSGKSTLLRVVAGFEREFKGECRLGITRRECVFVHQTPYFFRGTVLANVCYGLRAHGQRGTTGLKRARDWLERFGIGHLANSPARQLSGGEKKRAAIARALAISPKLLLLDEPFAEMDDAGIANVVAVLSEEKAAAVIAAPSGVPDHVVKREIRLTARTK